MENNNKLVIDLGYDHLQLVAEKNSEPDYNEIFVGLKRDDVWIQDLAIVGQKYHYDDDCKIVGEDSMRVLVYADEENEDYTNAFQIDIYHDPEETACSSKAKELCDFLHKYMFTDAEIEDILDSVIIDLVTESDLRIKKIYASAEELGKAYMEEKDVGPYIAQILDLSELGEYIAESEDAFLQLKSGRIVLFNNYEKEDVRENGTDIDISQISSCSSHSLDECEHNCAKYYSCSTVALANDILVEKEDNVANEKRSCTL